MIYCIVDNNTTSTSSFGIGASQATKVLRNYFADLSDQSSNLFAITMRLYSKKLISYEVLNDTMNSNKSGQDRSATLMFALKATIDAKPESLNTLIEVLRTNEALRAIADKMDSEIHQN